MAARRRTQGGMHEDEDAYNAALAVAACAVAAVASPRETRAEPPPRPSDGKKVAVDYGRPALKGRKLDELLKQLPADRIWRAGENQVTTLTTEGDILVGGRRCRPASTPSTSTPARTAPGTSCSTRTWACRSARSGPRRPRR